MTVFILAHGERPSDELIERLALEADLFVATDGAANDLAGITAAPDVILGDFDSLHEEARARFPAVRLVAAPNQDASDLEKAVQYALRQRAERIRIAGALGGRIDHTLTNVSLLAAYGSKVDIAILDDESETRVVMQRHEFRGSVGDTLSLIPYGPVTGVSTEGLRWPLRAEALLPGSRGVSNVFVEKRAVVAVESGTLAAVHLRRGVR